MSGSEKLSSKTITCKYCGVICVGTGSRDHVHPRSRGGVLLFTNKAYSCKACNQAKSDMSIDDFRKTDYWKANCASGRWKGYKLT